MATQLAAEKAQGIALMPVRPEAGQPVMQNPPGFTWPLPRQDASPQFTLEIRHPDQRLERIALAQNWYLPRTLWPAGRYAWRVTRGAGSPAVSEWRSFDLGTGAKPLYDAGQLTVVASDAAWHARIAATAHPRVLDASRLNQLLPVLAGSRRVAWNALLARVQSQLTDPAQAPATGPSPNDGTPGWVLAVARKASEEHDRIDNSAVAWRVLSTPGPLADAARATAVQADLRARVLNLARWDTTALDGQTSDTDSPVRTVLWALAMGYDQLYPVLTAADRATLRQAITVRAAQVEQRVFGSRHTLLRYPLDSHASAAMGALAAASAVMSGDDPAFGVARFARVVPFMYAYVHPWGGADGGWANGGAYGEWFMNNLFPYFDGLSAAAGVDIYRVQQLQNYPRYRLYAIPPGTLQAPFGDGSGMEGNQVPYYAYWLATRVPNPITQWLATRLPLAGNHAPVARTVASPAVEPATASAPGALSPSALFEGTGQVSMHSSLTEAARTSVHFRSSPYGALNHGHADQNHFIVGSQGKALLIDSGYYDFFDSPHAQAWYRQTRAHNAITYDGGTGQRTRTGSLPGDHSSAGQIIGWHDGNGFTVATGDATAAYDQTTVTRAVRSLAYVAPGLLLVHDDLAARHPVRWEWNFHTLDAPQVQGGTQGTVKVTRSTATLCMRQLAGDRFGELASTTQFPADPDLRSFAPQHHGTWRRSAASTQHHGVVLIDVGCTLATQPSVQETTEAITIGLGGRQFRFQRGELPAYAP